MSIDRETYADLHESAESLREDRDIHPALRRDHRTEWEKCRACGACLPIDELTEDLLCKECDEGVRHYEAINALSDGGRE